MTTPAKLTKQQERELRARIRRASADLLTDGADESEYDMYAVQVCPHCGGVGNGLGIEHTPECLVPLAAYAEDAADKGGGGG